MRHPEMTMARKKKAEDENRTAWNSGIISHSYTEKANSSKCGAKCSK